MSDSFAFCTMEDREGAEIGMRLTVLSVHRWCPGLPIFLFRPGCTPEFREWLRGFPEVRLFESPPSPAKGWDCKPSVLLHVFEQGYKEAVWLDSDLLLGNDCRKLFRAMSDEEIGLVQEQASSPNQGSEIRTKQWGFPVGRALDSTTNTCVIRATVRHLSLLRRWKELLASAKYQEWQSLALDDKPAGFMSDQDALCALLGAQEFAQTPVRYFRRGMDVLHSGGALAYTVKERLQGLFIPRPSFIHAGGTKPWVVLSKTRSLPGFFWWYRRLLQETSAYVAEARPYRERVGEDCPWLDWRTFAGVVIRLVGFGHFGLRGLPLAVAARLIESFRKRRAAAPAVNKPPAPPGA